MTESYDNIRRALDATETFLPDSIRLYHGRGERAREKAVPGARLEPAPWLQAASARK